MKIKVNSKRRIDVYSKLQEWIDTVNTPFIEKYEVW